MGKKALTVRVWGTELLPPQTRKPRLFIRACRAAFKAERAGISGEINVVFAGRRRMLSLNEKFLDHRHDTDVIAFGYDEGKILGDIFVSAFMAPRQARALKHSALKEAATLVVHGSLHLLGYDDKRPKDKAAMFRRQERIVESLGL